LLRPGPEFEAPREQQCDTPEPNVEGATAVGGLGSDGGATAAATVQLCCARISLFAASELLAMAAAEPNSFYFHAPSGESVPQYNDSEVDRWQQTLLLHNDDNSSA